MVRISDVTVVRNRIRIDLDNGEHYYLKKHDFSAFDPPLIQDTELDEEQFAEFVLLHQYPDALNHAVAMLALRPCSQQEIRKKLLNLRFSAKTADLVLLKLEKEELIDDREFAESWTRFRSGIRYGSRRIYRELLLKGIDKDTATAAIEEIDQNETMENAISLARKGLRSRKSTEDLRKTGIRVMNGLVRKGYDWETARKAWNTVVSEILQQ